MFRKQFNVFIRKVNVINLYVRFFSLHLFISSWEHTQTHMRKTVLFVKFFDSC